ncbi:MAG: BACON domain-containing carbohydrate-binding protein, partial [Mucinivorans sp.]
FAVDANTTHDNREAQIVVKSRTLPIVSDTLTIHQVQKNALILSNGNITMTEKGGAIDVELRTNIEYDILMPTGATWLTKVDSRALTTYHHLFQVAAYTGTDSRSAQVIFKDKKSQLADTLTVLQGQKGTLIISPRTQNLDETAHTVNVELQRNIQYDIVMPENVTWVRQISSRALVTEKLSFAVDANTTHDNREAQIVVKSRTLPIV